MMAAKEAATGGPTMSFHPIASALPIAALPEATGVCVVAIPPVSPGSVVTAVSRPSLAVTVPPVMVL